MPTTPDAARIACLGIVAPKSAAFPRILCTWVQVAARVMSIVWTRMIPTHVPGAVRAIAACAAGSVAVKEKDALAISAVLPVRPPFAMEFAAPASALHEG